MLNRQRNNPRLRATRWSILWICLLLSLHGYADTVVLHLRNGDRLTGQVVKEDANQVTLTTSWQKEVVVPVSLIERREKLPEEKPPVAAAENKAPTPPSPPAPSPPPPPATLPKPKSHWAAELNLGLDMVRSETDRDLYQGSFTVTHVRGRSRTQADYRAAHGETAGTVSANRMDGSLKTDVDLGAHRKIFVYNLAAAGFDDIRKIDLQYEVGPGFGYHLITLTNFVLNTELGGNYFQIHFADGTRRDEMNLRLAEDVTWALTPKVSIREKLEFLPKPDDFNVYRLRLESTLSYLLWKNLSLNLSVLDIYDTRPARTVTKNDLQIRSSIGIKF